LLPSTYRNNNIALQRILNHLSHFASHPQTLNFGTKNHDGAIFRLKL
jgi:hypothetical protein